MRFNLQDAANKYTSSRSRRKRWYKIVGCLAVVVVCGTIYTLTMPAVTLTHEPVCGMEEHEHDENCYRIEYINSQTILDCSVETLGVHTHTGNCYDDAGNLVCGYADFVIHTHDPNCYDQDGNLICTLPEIEEHIHSEECYEEKSILICGQEESEGHSHDDSCYETVRVLTCGREEIRLHAHSEACRDENGAFICGMVEVLEHQHTDACIETVEPIEVRELICELPEHTHDEDCFAPQIALFASDDAVALSDTTTSVTVKMEWAEDELDDRPASVQVQLLADGEPYGDPVTLNAENGWTYKWLNLTEGPAYTVQDVTVPGYTSSVADTSNSQEQEDLLENGGRFVFQVTGLNNKQDKYRGQYLAAKPGTDGLCYTTVLDDYACWDAQVVSGGVYVLTNCGNGMVLGRTTDSQAKLLSPSAAATSAKIYVYYLDSHLFFVNDGSTSGLTNGQYWYFGNDANPWASNIYHQLHETQLDQAQTYNLYQVPSTEVEYTITNTKVNIPPVSVTVTKVWDDGDSDARPASVTVKLMADSTEVKTITLSNDNNWTYTWPDMPADAAYTVREEVPDGYSCSVEQTGTASADNSGEVSAQADGGGLVFTITNTLDDVPNLTLHIWKTDATGQNFLSGAQLKLYAAADTGDGTYTAGELVTDGAWTSDSTSARTYSLPDGTYLIEESVAPDGYIPLSKTIVLKVYTENGTETIQIVSGLSGSALVPGEDDTVWTLYIPNSAGFQLPETGGPGTYWYILGGTLLIGAALLVYNKRTRAERGA